MSRPEWTLRDLYALAWLEQLEVRTPMPNGPATRLPLDDTGRAPVVPLRPNGGDRERPRGVCYSESPQKWCRWNAACRACCA